MKQSLVFKLFTGIMLLLGAQGVSMANSSSAQDLREMIGQDHLAPQLEHGYTGVADPELKARLNSQVDAAAEALAAAAALNADSGQLLDVMKNHILGIDRDSLDTEDAEQVASAFERMLDALGIESSQGLLNTWMYGFDPS
jgi:hypothetical protein